jgi:hypothetical protein
MDAWRTIAMSEPNEFEADGKTWKAVNADNVEAMRELDENSVHLTVTSIPFAALFCYSDSDRDFGNCASQGEFFEHFRFFCEGLLRITRPGRIAAIHCMLLPSSKVRDGHIGLKDFRGDTIRAMEAAGWIYHAETVIWKDPVTAMQRTKALGLLWKQLRKDSTMSRMGIPDYVCFFRKPGVNAEPVEHTHESFPVAQWQEWASPIWMDINQSKTLQARSVREDRDERHLCALQLEVIKRCVALYSNVGDIVFDPFGGIGSTGVVALEMKRKALMIELKQSYFRQMVANMHRADSEAKQPDLFATAEA